MTPAASAATSYDEVRYRTLPLTQTNPDRLATVATLFGLRPAPVARCRVLEIGCGDGGNLIPLAAAWPEAGARFTHRVVSPTTLRYEPVRVRVEAGGGHERPRGAGRLPHRCASDTREDPQGDHEPR